MSRYITNPWRATCPACGQEIHSAASPLTKAQQRLYDHLFDHHATMGFAPTLEEIAGELGYHSLSTIHEHLTNLERKGWIKRRYQFARAIECLVPLNRDRARAK